MTKVVIVGAGKGGRALLEMIVGDSTVSIVGVADANAWAPGLELARRLNIPVATDFRPLVQDPRADLIIDVTGNPSVAAEIHRLKASDDRGHGRRQREVHVGSARGAQAFRGARGPLLAHAARASAPGGGRLHHRPEPQDEGGCGADRASGAHAHHRPHPRRVGNGQGAGGARHPSLLEPARQAPGHRQLHRAHRVPHGVGAVRPQARRLHRSGGRQDRALREGRQRHHLPGRDRRHAAGDAVASSCACSRRARSSRWATR